MAFFDAATPSTPIAGSTPGPTITPVPAETAEPTNSGSFFDSVKAPAAPAESTPAAPKSGSFFDAAEPATPALPDKSIPSPYFSTTTPAGASMGFSTTTDPSGKPLFAYRNPGDTSTTTDQTRVATTFDPRVAQPLTKDQYYNPRAVVNRYALKQALGTPATVGGDELDHKIALAVGGSNQPQNLRDIPTAQNQEEGTYEEQLAQQVAAGKISYYDAQVLEAKNKGITLPWVSLEGPTSTTTPTPDTSPGAKFPVSPAPDIKDDFVNFLNDISGKVHSAFGAAAHAINTFAQGTDQAGQKIGTDVSAVLKQPFDTTDSGAKGAATAAWNSFTGTIDDSASKLNEMKDALTDYASDGSTTGTQATAAVGEAGLGLINGIFSPITAAFAGASKIPGLPGIAAQSVNKLFSAIGVGAADGATSILNALPFLTPEQKETLTPVISQAAALAAQIAVGKAGHDAVPVLLEKTQNILKSVSDNIKAIPNKEGGFVGPKISGTDTDNQPEVSTNPDENHMNDLAAHANDYVSENSENMKDDYEKQNGNVYNVDRMKDLIPGHTDNPTMSEAFHRPAANITGEMVNDKLEEDKGNGKDTVFMGGATGAGKSSAVEALSEGKDTGGSGRFDDAHAIIDGTLADGNRSRDQMRLSLKNGHPVEIRYVDNTPDRIIDNIVSRADAGGRTVPIETALDTLLKSRQNVLRANGEFEGNPDFNVSVIDNRGDVPHIVDDGIDYLKKNQYSKEDIAQAKEDAYAKVEQLHAQGKITEETYKGLIRRKPEGTSTEDIGRNGGESEEERGGKESPEVKPLPPLSEAEENAASEMQVLNREHSDALEDLEEKGTELENRREQLNEDPARNLAKYVAKSGEFEGRLPEVTGKKSGGIFEQKGDQIVTEHGFKDAESARTAWEKYSVKKKAFQKDIKAFQDSKRDLYSKFKEDIDQYGKGHAQGQHYDLEITEANKGVVPPTVRGGLQAPEMDFSKFKDIMTVRLGRDTMERNLEKVAGPYADELKDFVVEPVRENEVDRIHYTNEIRQEARAKMQDLGIKRGSDDDELIQVFGEGKMTIDDLRKATPNWKAVESATDYFRKVYDRMIDDWNIKRAEFGYQSVPKRPDYFRHFNDINQWTNSFGFLRKEGQLPTEIAGKTAFFRPGKPFSTAELSRTGDKTSYTAIGGMDNYLESVSKQMFHIDSIQRGRALDKYLTEVAKKNPALKLANFAQNLTEWTNLVSGKAAMLDRSIESVVGRPVMKFLKGMSNLIGRNIIAGNISVALTHLVSIPLNLATVDKVAFIRGLYKSLVTPLQADDVTHINGVESSFLTRRYPEQSILPSKFQSSQHVLNWLFKVTDQFKTRLAVASKYYEGLDNGMSKEDAMSEADKYAGRIVGDYSTGNRPNLMNTNTMNLLAQFELGVNDNLSVLMHDIPHWAKGDKFKIGTRLVQFMVFSYLFNQVYKEIRGAGKGIDPIDAGLTITGLNDEGRGQDFVSRLKLAGGDVAGELPFTSTVAGTFPLATAVAEPLENLATGAKPRLSSAESLAADVASPIGGGAQAKKTIQGIEAVNKGQTTTARGQKNVTVAPTAENYIKGAVFGPSALDNANGANNETGTLINLLNANQGKATVQAEKAYSDMKGSADAATQFTQLQQSNPALAKTVETIATQDKEGITLNERLIKNLGVTDGQRAKYIADQINKLTSQTAKAALYDRYVTLKIISPQVASQLGPLIEK